MTSLSLALGSAPPEDEDNPEVRRMLRSGEEPVQSVAFPPDGKLLATASGRDARSVLVWDVATGKEKFELPGHKRSWLVAFLPGGKELLANSGPDLTVQVWNLETKKVRLAIKKPLGIGSPYAISRNGKWLAATHTSGTIHLYNLDTGKAGITIKGSPQTQCLTFSPDGKRLVSGHIGGGLFVWDAVSGECLGRPVNHVGIVVAICFAPDGKTFYSAVSNRQVFHWDAETCKPLQKVDLSRVIREPFYHGALSPDGRTLALQSKTQVVLYDVQTQKVRKDFGGEGQGGVKYGLAFSPDGKLLATASGSVSGFNCVYLWNVPSPPKK